MSHKYWDKAWSLVEGCTPVSEACDNCWLAGMERRFAPQFSCECGCGTVTSHTDVEGRFNGDICICPDRLDIPLKRKKPTVWAVWSDLFHEDVPDSFQYDALCKMAEADRHTYLLLTKRPQNIQRALNNFEDWDPTETGFIYFGTTVENQRTADERIPHLLKIPGKKFLSIEPLFEPIDLSNICIDASTEDNPGDIRPIADINWVIVGAESIGNSAGRECKIEWIESIVDQCRSAGIPVFVKQIHMNGKLVKDINQFPEHLRIREKPF